MTKEMVREVIKNALYVESHDITAIQPALGGMTNVSYFATVGEDEFVIRLPGKGTEQLIDRKVERENLIYGTVIGINPELIYFNDISGVKITRKIKNAIEMTPELAREGSMMKEIIALFQHLHQPDLVMTNCFDLFSLIDHYESLVKKENFIMMEKLAPLKEGVLVLEEIYHSFSVNEVPCHIDPVCANIMVDETKRLYLIDWEYSGMFDPMWDLATLFLSLQFTDEEELFFLKYYFGRDPNLEEMQRIILLKIFMDYLWSLWSFYKEAKGDNYESSGFKRIERAKNNIELFRTVYDRYIVV